MNTQDKSESASEFLWRKAGSFLEWLDIGDPMTLQRIRAGVARFTRPVMLDALLETLVDRPVSDALRRLP